MCLGLFFNVALGLGNGCEYLASYVSSHIPLRSTWFFVSLAIRKTACPIILVKVQESERGKLV